MTNELKAKRRRERELEKLARLLFGVSYDDLDYTGTQAVEREYARRILEQVRKSA
jgi:hypothetical protein